MADVGLFIARLRGQLEPLEDRLRDHPYLRDLEAGSLPSSSLWAMAGEQYHVINSDLRSIALLLNRHAHLPSRDYLLASLQSEVSARSALLAYVKALGMTEDDLRAYEPLPACQAYPAYVAWLSLYGSDAEFAAAFLVNLPAWGAACGRVSAALRSKYGLSTEAVTFFDLFAQSDPGFEAESLRVIEQGLDRRVDQRAIARAARLIQAYELMYWDGLHQAAKGDG